MSEDHSSIVFTDFVKVDMRVATIVEVDDFPRARSPSYIVTLDFGPDSVSKRSSVQATNYKKEQLIGKQVVCVVNLPSKNIAGFWSEALVLGVPGEDGKLALLSPDRTALCNGRVY